MSVLERLRDVKPDVALSSDEIFDAIFVAGSKLNDDDRENDEALEIAIRLLEAERLGAVPETCFEAIEFLAEECGLYPYIEPQRFSHITQTVIEAHSIKLKDAFRLHSKQMQILLWLLNGDNVVLSAPTSFGKSVLLDAFIAHARPKTIVMIVPTIALIDEARRRLQDNFGNEYEILTSTHDEYDASHPSIFVLTQERFLQRKDIENIDLLFIDEFYKLDPSRHDSRFETLNLALYYALPRARQCFMAGPYIRTIDFGEKWTGNFRFVRTDYRTVTVNVIDRSDSEDKKSIFLADLSNSSDEQSLVFAASPASAETLMGEIIESGITATSQLNKAISEWIASNYHAEWKISYGCLNGVIVHHGRLPRSLGQLFVRLFDEGTIRVLICTSTLIEGVNTSAANVFIYDKKINRTDFDFFSFSNIRGRVGRMMRHFVGNAYLYHEPPKEIETRVEVPILSDPGASTDFLIMNVEGDELSDAGRERQLDLPLSTGLPETFLKEHGALGIETLKMLQQKIQEILDTHPEHLVWSGLPGKDQKSALASLAVAIAHDRNQRMGIFTDKQVRWAWDQLAMIKTMPAFLRWFSRTFYKDDIANGIDSAFQFLQACEFNFPRSLGAIEALVSHLTGDKSISYGLYIVALENWFRPPWMKQLDEAGIPVPLAERLFKHIQPVENRKMALSKIAGLRAQLPVEFDDVDRMIIDHAIVR